MGGAVFTNFFSAALFLTGLHFSLAGVAGRELTDFESSFCSGNNSPAAVTGSLAGAIAGGAVTAILCFSFTPGFTSIDFGEAVTVSLLSELATGFVAATEPF